MNKYLHLSKTTLFNLLCDEHFQLSQKNQIGNNLFQGNKGQHVDMTRGRCFSFPLTLNDEMHRFPIHLSTCLSLRAKTARTKICNLHFRSCKVLG